ncbi:hypothetical protein Tco_0374615 [Tanacetum coccineum]
MPLPGCPLQDAPSVVGWQWGGGGSGGGESRVGESDMGDRIDPLMRSIFGVRQKGSPEKFSGGGDRGRRI